MFIDYFLGVIHSLFVLFTLTGWAWRRTRLLHLITTSLTLFFWFALGSVYGWGYCPCTDWHWAVKRSLGEVDLPASYIKYYLDKLTGLAWDPLLVDATVLMLGLLAFALSCWFNWQGRHSGSYGRP